MICSVIFTAQHQHCDYGARANEEVPATGGPAHNFRASKNTKYVGPGQVLEAKETVDSQVLEAISYKRRSGVGSDQLQENNQLHKHNPYGRTLCLPRVRFQFSLVFILDFSLKV